MTIQSSIQLFFTVIGALYTVASAISLAAPNSKAGMFCAKLALALRQVNPPKS